MLNGRLGIRSDTAGVAVTELALVLPVLLLLLLGMIDVSRMFAARLALEQAAQRTTDLALARPPSSSDTFLRDEAMAVAGVPAENVTVELILECNGTPQSDYSTSCPEGAFTGRYASVSIVKQAEPIFDWTSLSQVLGLELSPTVVSGDSLVRLQ
ncbi:hypothetical protein GRI75_07555 [Altererythrobacter soli]|uniref:TadE-like domain-containing protein n=1 Tax=Croceibacterium soli TaxID=1739690 RepID=A0A6I4US89_9SPHN|nr:TadE/TadG family type IV pilus assembly protein [Croceibacterium soli]MXP41498.1 hypothetical protein [Croceibacterium soli]